MSDEAFKAANVNIKRKRTDKHSWRYWELFRKTWFHLAMNTWSSRHTGQNCFYSRYRNLPLPFLLMKKDISVRQMTSFLSMHIFRWMNIGLPSRSLLMRILSQNLIVRVCKATTRGIISFFFNIGKANRLIWSRNQHQLMNLIIWIYCLKKSLNQPAKTPLHWLTPSTMDTPKRFSESKFIINDKGEKSDVFRYYLGWILACEDSWIW